MNRSRRYQIISISLLLSLILLCFLWEWVIAPIRPGGSWVALKSLPLVVPLSGFLKGRPYTFQYTSMLVLFYLAEGVVRLLDSNPYSQLCALLEVILSLGLFVISILYIRSRRKH